MLEWWQIAGVAAGALLCALGLLVIRLAQRDLRGDRADGGSGPTRLTLGVICLFWGFHAAVWSLPPGWQPACVPVRMWWIAVLVTVAAVGGSWLADRLDDRDSRGSDLPG